MQQVGKFEPGFGAIKFGSNFWNGAKPNPDEVVGFLENGTSISVFGLRRIGKSSLLAEASERLRNKGRNVIWIDHNSVAKVLATILNSLPESENGVIGKAINWIKREKGIPSELKAKSLAVFTSKAKSWTQTEIEELEDALIGQLDAQFNKQKGREGKPIIIFDELTLMLDHILDNADLDKQRKIVAKLNLFLGLLRNWRSDYVGVTMAICGSMSMDQVQKKYGIKQSLINDCINIHVEEMEYDQARGLLEACIQSKKPVDWTGECVDELLDMLPVFYPGVIQLAYSAIKGNGASLEALRGPLHAKIENEIYDKYCRQFSTMYDDFSESDLKRIRTLFNAIGSSEPGKLDRESALQELISSNGNESGRFSEDLLFDLRTCGFLRLTESKEIAFDSDLVGLWWRKRTSDI